MDLIAEYISSVLELDNIDKTGYEKRKSVLRNNKLADRVRAIATEINSSHPQMKPEFYQLLFFKEGSVSRWAAHHVLEVMDYDMECRKTALKKIESVGTYGDGVEALGNKMWLDEWLKKHPEDRELL